MKYDVYSKASDALVWIEEGGFFGKKIDDWVDRSMKVNLYMIQLSEENFDSEARVLFFAVKGEEEVIMVEGICAPRISASENMRPENMCPEIICPREYPPRRLSASRENAPRKHVLPEIGSNFANESIFIMTKNMLRCQ